MALGRLLAQSEERAITRANAALDAWYRDIESGYRVTNLEDALAVSTFYACVMLRAEMFGSMPVETYTSVPGSNRREVTVGPRWLYNPNDEMSWAQYVMGVSWSLDVHGDLFEYIYRDRSNRVEAIEMIDPARVSAARMGTEHGAPIEYRVDGKEVRQTRRGPQFRHGWIHRLPGRILGATPLEHANDTLALGGATQRFGREWFENGRVPSGVLESEGTADIDVLRMTKAEFMRGDGRVPRVLQAGMKYRQVSVSPEESQFLDTRRFTAAEICAVMRVPPEFVAIGVEGSSLLYQNVSSSWLAVIRRALMAPMRILQDWYSDLVPVGQRMRFDPEVYLKPDRATRMETHKLAVESGITTPNEIRRIEEMDPHPDGDVLYIPAGVTGPANQEPAPADQPTGGEAPGNGQVVPFARPGR